MHVHKAFAGAVGFAVIAAAAPTLSYSEDTCIPTISTVFATPSAVYITVTIHDAPESTIYVTVPSISYVRLSELPATTQTRVKTSAKPTTAPKLETITRGGNMAAHSVPTTPVYDFTVTETAVVTVTLDGSKFSTSNRPLSFVVVDGTTSWLGGQTPAPGETYIYTSSVVTVVPVVSKSEDDPTTTLTSTIRLTSEVTVTKPLPSSKTLVLNGASGGTFTGMATGGWNATTIAVGFIGTGLLTAGTAPTSSKPTLVTDEPTFDLYPTTTRSAISVSSYAAQSGFRQYTTLTAPAITSAAGGWTTAVVNDQTWSWVAPGSSPTPVVPSSALPPFVNSTFSTSRPSGVPSSNSTFSSAISSGAANFTIVLSNISTAPSTTTANQTSPSVTPTASAMPTKCGISGDFTLNFDDIPPLAIGNQSIDDVAPLPVFNPYHQFDFSDGFTVVPPPRAPYLPSSKPLLLEFIPNFTVNRTDDESGPNAREFGWSGDIGNGDHGLTGCFSFNMYGASFGCDSRGPDCIFTFSGFRYDRATKLTNQVTTQSITVPACPKLNECPLTPVVLDNTFQNMDAVRMNVTVAGLPKIWWVDDVRLGWFNNSCITGLCRQTTKIH